MGEADPSLWCLYSDLQHPVLGWTVALQQWNNKQQEKEVHHRDLQCTREPTWWKVPYSNRLQSPQQQHLLQGQHKHP